VFCAFKARASYRAGEITYRWIQGYTYEIKFTTYTTGNSPDSYCIIDSSICTGGGGNGKLYRSNGPCNGLCTPNCDGLMLAPGIKKNEYITQRIYPGPGSYKLCFFQGSRNSGINNIPNSINATFLLETTLIISTFSGPNNSPVFSMPAVASGCLNTGCFSYNPGATDSNGDSLSYEIIPYNHLSGSSLPGSVSNFTVHPSTGTVTWCNPFWAGDANFILRVKEWRNTNGSYTTTGYVDRDIQLSMSVCTGVDDFTKNTPQVDLYPNPFTDVLTLSVQNNKGPFTVELYDIAGRKLSTLLNSEPITRSTSLELGGVGPGIYLLKISGSSGTVTKKIIKH
jgi:hypothetical protein